MTGTSLEQIFQAANQARQQGDLNAAQKVLHEGLSIEPENPALRNALGNIALDLGDQAGAIDHFHAAIAADQSAPVLWLNLARAYREAGEQAGEREALDGALALDQRNVMARVRRAEWFERHDKEADSFLDWSGVLQMLSGADMADPAVADIVARARAAVDTFTAGVSAVIDPAIQDASSGMDYEETRRFDTFYNAALGRRRIYRNECAGLMYPMLPADEFFPRSHFAWMDDFEKHVPAIRAELQNLLLENGEGFRPYVSMPAGTPDNKWSPLNNSDRWNAGYLWKYGAPKPDMLAACPQTAQALEQVARFDAPGRGPTAFFSLLKAKSHIPPHTGVSNLRAIVHVPLIVPPGCWFRVGGETRLWEDGKAFAFDDTIEHEARNESEELRAVLIFDVWNPHILPHERELIRTFFTSAEAAGMPTEKQFDI